MALPGGWFIADTRLRDVVENLSFEEVAFLLWEGRLPNQSELTTLKQELAAAMVMPRHVNAILHALPKQTEPMDALRTAASGLGAVDPDVNSNDPDANRRKAIRLTAEFPTIVTGFHRLRQGHEPIEPDPNLGLAANFLYMMTGKKPHDTVSPSHGCGARVAREHGMNASTFAARVIAATLPTCTPPSRVQSPRLKARCMGGQIRMSWSF